MRIMPCKSVSDKEDNKKMQYTVDFGRTADRIQMEATKSTTLSAQGGGMGAKTDCIVCRKETMMWNIL